VFAAGAIGIAVGRSSWCGSRGGHLQRTFERRSDGIEVVVLHSLSGTMAISEVTVRHPELLAIE
jgi:putative hemolysin